MSRLWKLPKSLPMLCVALAVLAAYQGTETSTPEIASPTATSEVSVSTEAPQYRYVNSAWVAPHNADEISPFAQELRAFVITTQDELDLFNGGITSRGTRGTTTSLGRIDFLESVLVAAYYVWKPVQGDPLSVVGFALDGDQAIVELDLEESPQGRPRPYMLAPMTMVAVDRSIFPSGQPIAFDFQLNGEPAAKVVATIE
ncbi:MAG: hypothetical protein BZY88_10330 [SAR202 cluster bacterium Io17-Chloro-G9]|nr:MAG: hypothetical protein BZY88_10330 [SAR202 cluster bacterium Io17-Chloro-G9]